MEIESWYWLVTALVLAAVEAFVPGTFFIWLAVAAAVVGLTLMAVPDLPWQVQFLAFAILSIGSAVGFRQYQRRHPVTSADPTLNRRGASLVGRLVVLERPIVNGRGHAFVGDTLWTVTGEDQPAGSTVRVVGTDGIMLKVESPDRSG
ncbi:NfeD family protein [Skermanella mucosa]|uniref:NfeD family protein n=1 Tax=Skermanella mucosa TaxID=1789672 RepID=UPI00192B4902|nr:NfeD family protein [Skermanella mucosa]UEM22627.1 NfeD family protein [Skermanella mucosa]